MTPIHTPPAPMPIRNRETKYTNSPSPNTKPNEPRAATVSEIINTRVVRPRLTPTAASREAPTLPSAKLATTTPIRPGPAPVDRAMAGVTGAMML